VEAVRASDVGAGVTLGTVVDVVDGAIVVVVVDDGIFTSGAVAAVGGEYKQPDNFTSFFSEIVTCTFVPTRTRIREDFEIERVEQICAVPVAEVLIFFRREYFQSLDFVDFVPTSTMIDFLACDFPRLTERYVPFSKVVTTRSFELAALAGGTTRARAIKPTTNGINRRSIQLAYFEIGQNIQ